MENYTFVLYTSGEFNPMARVSAEEIKIQCLISSRLRSAEDRQTDKHRVTYVRLCKGWVDVCNTRQRVKCLFPSLPIDLAFLFLSHQEIPIKIRATTYVMYQACSQGVQRDAAGKETVHSVIYITRKMVDH